MNHKDIFHGQTIESIKRGFTLAAEMGHGFAGSAHILWALCEADGGAAAKVLQRAGIDQKLVRDFIEKYDADAMTNGRVVALSLASEADRVIESAEAQSKKLHHQLVEPEHLLLGILQERDAAAAQLLFSAGADADAMMGELLEKMGSEWPRKELKSLQKKKPETQTLDHFSRDLTEMAQKGKLDPVIGREKEISRVVQILSRRSKNNPALIGEPGVGKTAIAEGLAQRIVSGDIPENLADHRVMSLDLGRMLSGTKYRGDFEERVKTYLEEAQLAGNIILFIDEMHTLIGSGAAEGAMDAANAFKPALGRGEIQVIGATTLNEYKKHIEKDSALERRFQPVSVNETTPQDTVLILKGLREKYEEHHKLKITDEALEAAVELSSRYIQNRFLPDKAIDLIDEAGSRVRTSRLMPSPKIKKLDAEILALKKEKEQAVAAQNFEQAAILRDKQNELKKQQETQRTKTNQTKGNKVTGEEVAAVVSAWTGIPVTMLTQQENERLRGLEDTLHDRLVGQEEAVKAVSKAIRRSRVGIKQPGRPIGSFLFLGPTGVGKTELCRALAQAMFQDEDAIIRIDMSEYMERHTVSKLIGSPPGYVGYDEGGQLTEKVRRKPYSIVLFDEIEKAHPDVWNALLQIMDDGHLSDAQGRKVDFKNTVIVMTSNLGAREITGKSSLGFGKAQQAGETRPLEELRGKVMEELKRTFQPEFLNRIDDIIVFHQLTRTHIRDIARNMLRDLTQRAKQLGIALELDESAVDLLADKGFDPVYGARPLRRTIQSLLEDAIAEAILGKGFTKGDRMLVSAVEGEISIQNKPAKKKRIAV